MLAEKFNVTSKQQNWSNIINDIQGRVRGICENTHGSDWKLEEKFYSNVLSHLHFVKNAWRNYVMHGHDHYDLREGQQVFKATQTFMAQLAPKFT